MVEEKRPSESTQSSITDGDKTIPYFERRYEGSLMLKSYNLVNRSYILTEESLSNRVLSVASVGCTKQTTVG